ncbi:hypothetical protein [Modestobacter roseus]|uniref:Uncharacterized protein n=1 Tax=Modestobacter roseus TaxID=1181884 RepID=A0A562IRC0_9ACTN|nr:hypothetical protein [Modestobacter roseus]MQA32069.1 hypothetical protein [Modestobacter roseus]TWH73400.1 hypothetical protein JD78_01923 [Modestobacter roseus]
MQPQVRSAAWVVVLGALGALTGCAGGDGSGPRAADGVEASEIARQAAESAGVDSAAAVGGDAQTMSDVSLDSVTTGATHSAFAACTGGGSMDLDLLGEVVTVDCDGEGHRFDGLGLTDDVPTFRVVRPNDAPGTWGVALTVD